MPVRKRRPAYGLYRHHKQRHEITSREGTSPDPGIYQPTMARLNALAAIIRAAAGRSSFSADARVSILDATCTRLNLKCRRLLV